VRPETNRPESRTDDTTGVGIGWSSRAVTSNGVGPRHPHFCSDSELGFGADVGRLRDGSEDVGREDDQP